ncbi:hypothetical protein [Saccharopolyspora endophytica]|uniref:Rep2 n=1 Tax=Saccharopolyspora endophytica TaxID=543886 RepID=A0A0C5BKC4_9PSEU|nr:hypothetical protein [Saccharopolyspora endophytica]AJM87328.1 Rep2 [Saccharopolyspora endophytica]MBQ0928827.1 hypothetical protein [Saccharopolyspora endophytica]
MSEPHTNTGRPSLWPVGPDGRPKVKVSTNPDAMRVLYNAVGNRLLPDTYVQDGSPVVVEAISGAGDPTAGDDDVALPLAASELRAAGLASLLAEHAHVVKPEMDKAGNTTEVEFSPPTNVLNAVLSRRSWPDLPVLRRIISTPVLRPDGTLLQEPGYDPATGYLLASRTHLEPVPERPSAEQVAEAREFMLERFLHDFPWRSPADRANYLGLLITPIIRPFTRALSPFGVIDATMPGSGKTILSGCVGLLVGQRVMTWTDSEDELRKGITSVLADQVGVVVFDNLEEGAVINSAVLARLVTERTWTDRKLGTNTTPTFPNDRLWLATGNNLRVGGDMASRTVWVRLDPDCPRPEARAGFTIPNLDSWILDPANQATVLRHVLTLILDWTAHGAPISTQVPQMRQFTRWAQHIGGFLEHHGIGGFLANAESSRALDDDAAEWRAFLLRWHALHGEKPLTANELRASAEPSWGTDPWVGSFPTTARGDLPSVKALGRKLTGQIGRWRGDVVLRSVIDEVTNARSYRVQRQPETP